VYVIAECFPAQFLPTEPAYEVVGVTVEVFAHMSLFFTLKRVKRKEKLLENYETRNTGLKMF
jgi:hypothetical protein